ncbi:hypothetical protein [Streptomyces sp. NPDC056480]|uniref:hypothetical protein n=1 Tax=Streptomyces sp. NPDC056480 TaxID=3345833 RepID=UPI0036A2D015
MTTETEKARAFLRELQAQAAEATGMRDVEHATDWQERMVEIGRRMPEVSEELLRWRTRRAARRAPSRAGSAGTGR